MTNKLRQNPLVCLILSLFRLATGKLRRSGLYLGESLSMDDSSRFRIFRHIAIRDRDTAAGTVFIVRFKFSRLSHSANKKASILPMLLITGFPGFERKIYAVDPKNGHWQGMYQWKTSKHLEAYKKSFVFRMMNKRAIPASVSSFERENENLLHFIEGYITEQSTN